MYTLILLSILLTGLGLAYPKLVWYMETCRSRKCCVCGYKNKDPMPGYVSWTCYQCFHEKTVREHLEELNRFEV